MMTKKKMKTMTNLLNQNDREYIKLLYDNFLKINLYIKDAIKKRDIETINYIFGKKNQLIKQITSFEKIHQKEIKEDKELYSIKLDLIKKEKENISLLEKIKKEAQDEFDKIKKTKKLYQAYEPALNETRSTVDIKDEEA